MVRSASKVDDIGAAKGPLPVPTPAWERKGTVYVVGVDGLTLDVIGPMVEKGELPNFARLAQQGCHGRLKTIWPTNSSLLWTTIATGRHHRDHGIDGFQYYRILGRHLSRSTVRRYKKLKFRKLVFHLVMGLLKLLRLRKRYYFDGRHVRTKTFWDIISEAGGRVGVVNWWHSWPARPLNGFVVSDKLHYWRSAYRGAVPVDTHLTYPESLLEEIRDLIVTPDQVGVEEMQKFIRLPASQLGPGASAGLPKRDPLVEVRFLVSSDRTYSRIFEHCLNAFPDVRLAAVYFRGPDLAQHCGFDYMASSVASKATAEQREVFGQLVPQAYRFADELVGRVLGRLGPDDTLFVLSDHGYGFHEGPSKHSPYGHTRGEPPGVIYAYGREFERGLTIRNATIYDIAPTVLRVCGFPVALDMEGRCLEEAFTAQFRNEFPPPDPVATYGTRLSFREAVLLSAEVNKQITEHLRSLGYLE